MFKKILVGYDGSKGGKAALQRAAVMAKQTGAELTALWVREPLPRHSDLPGEYEEEAEAADEYFKERQKEVAEAAAQHGLQIKLRNPPGTSGQDPGEVCGGGALRPGGGRPQRPLGVVGAPAGRHGRPDQRSRPMQRLDRQTVNCDWLLPDLDRRIQHLPASGEPDLL